MGHRPLGQLAAFAREVGVELDVESPRDCARIELQVAHQLSHHVTPQDIVVVQRVAALHGEAPRVDGLVVRAQLLGVLREGAGHVADGRDAEPDHVGRGPRRVPHEVAMQRARRGGTRELVVGQREVVHADRHVAGGEEARARSSTNSCSLRSADGSSSTFSSF